MHVVVKEADIMADQGSILEGRIGFDTNHGDWVVKDHGVESMDHIQGKAVQTDRNGGDGGSHGQGVFGRQPKHNFPKYPGNDPEWIELRK